MINQDTIISVFDDKMTLLQYLKTLDKTLDESSLSDLYVTETNGKYKVTLEFADGSKKESNLYGLTIDEQGGVTIDSAQTITGSKTFKSPIKSNEIDNEKGNALLRFKETEEKNIVGGSNYPLTLMGSEDRPSYSKDGSDFEGNPLALKSDVDSNWDLLMANLGIGRYSNQIFNVYAWTTDKNEFYDDLAPYYTNCTRYLANSKFNYNYPTYMMNDYTNKVDAAYMFWNYECSELHLSNMKISSAYSMFYGCTASKILIREGCEVYFSGFSVYAFRACSNLVEIGAIDMKDAYEYEYMFEDCTKIKSIHMKHFTKSFRINFSTEFEETDLVEIISNLDTVTTTQTLTMGATNLAKLTDDEKKVATEKGWTLA